MAENTFLDSVDLPWPEDDIVDTDGSLRKVSCVWSGCVELANGSLIRGHELERLVQLSPKTWKVSTQEEFDVFQRESKYHLASYGKLLNRNFLEAEAYLANRDLLPNIRRKLIHTKVDFIQQWASEISDNIPDKEQAEVIGTVKGNILVTARAGSGKTSTLVNRALFLIEHCSVPPNRILLLAFNRSAAFNIHLKILSRLSSETEREVHSRLKTKTKHSSQDKQSVLRSVAKKRNVDLPEVMTFHALAYALVHPSDGLLGDIPGGEQLQSQAIQEIVDDWIRDPTSFSRIRNVMHSHFRADWEKIIKGGYERDQKSFLRYRRSIVNETLNGDYVKSFGEKIIADFLFEHDVPYKYERNFLWNEINYKPDFTISNELDKDRSVIIEYFGLSGDPDYDEMSREKRKFWGKRTEIFLEYSPRDISKMSRVAFYEKLQADLKSSGIRCNKLSDEEIWERSRKRAIDRFTKLVGMFIVRCRQRVIAPDDVEHLLKAHSKISDIEVHFYALAKDIYAAYLERLEATGEEDYNGLMQRAATLVEEGRTEYKTKTSVIDLSHLQHICIDEYQDFSELFYRLLKSIHNNNPDVNLCCVGDDWQAINGFAGSDLKFFNNFGEYFNDPIELSLSKNYRSSASIVDAGNRLMSERGRPSESARKELGSVQYAAINEFRPSNGEEARFHNDLVSPLLLRLIKHALDQSKRIAIISRTNRIPYFFDKQSRVKGFRLDAFEDHIKRVLPEQMRNEVTVSTTHKFKGLERDMVVVIDAIDRSYPLIHPDWVFFRLFGDNLEDLIDAERRLFYVALTRAADDLIIVTDSKSQSRYLSDNLSDLDQLDCGKYDPYLGQSKRRIVLITNQESTNGTYPIRNELKASSYRWQSREKSWIKSFPIDSFDLEVLAAEVWNREADGVLVKIFDDYENLVAQYKINSGKWEKLR